MKKLRTHVLQADRGEILVEDGGHEDGLAVVVHPGSPESRLLFAAGTRLAVTSGRRLLSFDRPRCGSRAPRPAGDRALGSVA